jgi:VWFA-related protein
MRRPPVVVALLVSTLTLEPHASWAGPQAAPAADARSQDVPVFSVATDAVTLDVIVRDKKGNAIRDLKASEFQVFEDGVKQAVDQFQVFGQTAPPPAAAAKAAPASATPVAAAPAAPPEDVEPERNGQVIAFVFDRLSAESRDMAHKAAMTYLEKGHVDGDLVGVFTIDLALRTVQPFTRETSLIRVGLDKASSQGNTGFGDTLEAGRGMIDTIGAAQDATLAASAATPGGGPGAAAQGNAIAASAGSAALNQALATVQVGMLRSFESLERDQQGFASTNGLLAVVSGLKSLPGRKTVIFFSEGLAIPANVQAQFKSVIGSANRANVSVYAMDAGGLRTNTVDHETREEMLQAARQRIRQLESGRDDAVNGVMSKGLERNEALLHSSPEAGLGQLANQTGGFLIHDTNDAGAAFRRIEEDMRFYYLLSYSPSNTSYDGRFRTISVKVTRPGAQVQTREGYFALKPVESTPLKAFEAPALAQLDRPQRPNAFPLQALGLSFPSAKRPGLSPILVHVPADTVAYVLDKNDKSNKKMYRADFTVVVRVSNEAKHEVDRLSQHYALSVAEENLPAARKGDILFYREADLAPGRYTLDAVGYDAVSGRASVTSALLDVQRGQADRPRLSSIVLVGRAEKTTDPQGDNPLFFGDTILYPNMGDAFKKSKSPALGFFFTVYGVKEKTTSRKATLEIYKGDQAAGKVTADLPEPDANGRIQYAGALPLQGFPVGAYKLKVTASDGTSFDTQQTSFTVAE